MNLFTKWWRSFIQGTGSVLDIGGTSIEVPRIYDSKESDWDRIGKDFQRIGVDLETAMKNIDYNIRIINGKIDG